MSGPVRLVLADDHPIFVEGLQRLLGATHEVVAVVADGEALLEAVAEHHPDVVVADVSMPGTNGIEATRRIRDRHPEVRVVLLTMHDQATYAVEALDAGASGYVLKQADPDEILTAIEVAQGGEVFLSPSMASAVFKAQRRSGGEPRMSELTERQREVLALLVEGCSAKEIGARLHLSRKTVEYHKYRMRHDLGLHSSAELLQYALKHGIGEV